MADIRIKALPATTTLTTSHAFAVDNGTTTQYVAWNNLFNNIPAQVYINVAANGLYARYNGGSTGSASTSPIRFGDAFGSAYLVAGSGSFGVYSNTSQAMLTIAQSAARTVTIPGYTSNGALSTISSNGTLSVTSDARLKTPLTPFLSSVMPIINSITPGNYEFLAEPGTKKAGFIAQDIEQHIPEAVDGKKYEYLWETNLDGTPKFDEQGNIVYAKDEDGNLMIRPRGLDDRALIAYLWRAVQELDSKVTVLAAQLEALA